MISTNLHGYFGEYKMKKKDKLPDIRQTIDIKAKREKVWNAITKSEELSKWFMPNDIKPILGDDFTLHTDFGVIPCKVTKIIPRSLLSFSWGNFGWQVYFELEDHNGKTRFTVIHTGWGEPDMNMPNMPEKQSVIWDRMNGGWLHLIEGLRGQVEGTRK
jgi:uncharacterized protein YndB with AHSA1/START domain